MRHGQTYTIGIVIPDVSNPFFADLARAIEDVTFAGGYSAIFCNSDGDEGKEARYLDVLLSKQVDGLLLISAGQSSERLRRVVETGPPMVIVDRELDDLGVSQVMVDNHEGGRLAGRYLVGLGHRRIGVIVGPDILRPSARRLDGFRAELAVVRSGPLGGPHHARQLPVQGGTNGDAVAAPAPGAPDRCLRGERPDGVRRHGRHP